MPDCHRVTVSEEARRFAELALRLQAEPGVPETVSGILQFAVEAVDCRDACVWLAGRGGRRIDSVTSTDPRLKATVDGQLSGGDGPTLVAVAERGSILIDDTVADGRWPRWSSQVGALGIRSALVIPLRTVTSVVGALNLYSTAPNGFDRSDVEVAHLLAQHAAVALATAREEETLNRAVDARMLVGQAQGILMQRHGIGAEQAFAVLRRYSQEHNVKLQQVARTLVGDWP